MQDKPKAKPSPFQHVEHLLKEAVETYSKIARFQKAIEETQNYDIKKHLDIVYMNDIHMLFTHMIRELACISAAETDNKINSSEDKEDGKSKYKRSSL